MTSVRTRVGCKTAKIELFEFAFSLITQSFITYSDLVLLSFFVAIQTDHISIPLVSMGFLIYQFLIKVDFNTK